MSGCSIASISPFCTVFDSIIQFRTVYKNYMAAASPQLVVRAAAAPHSDALNSVVRLLGSLRGCDSLANGECVDNFVCMETPVPDRPVISVTLKSSLEASFDAFLSSPTNLPRRYYGECSQVCGMRTLVDSAIVMFPSICAATTTAGTILSLNFSSI